MQIKMEITDLLRTLAEPHRRQIFDWVSEKEWSAGDLHRALGGLTFGAVSQHLTRLQEAGLIRARFAGKNRFYNGVPEALAPLRHWLSRHTEPASDPGTGLAWNETASV